MPRHVILCLRFLSLDERVFLGDLLPQNPAKVATFKLAKRAEKLLQNTFSAYTDGDFCFSCNTFIYSRLMYKFAKSSVYMVVIKFQIKNTYKHIKNAINLAKRSYVSPHM